MNDQEPLLTQQWHWGKPRKDVFIQRNAVKTVGTGRLEPQRGEPIWAQGANPGLSTTIQIPLVFRDPPALCVIPFHSMSWNGITHRAQELFLSHYTQGLHPGLIWVRAFSPQDLPCSPLSWNPGKQSQPKMWVIDSVEPRPTEKRWRISLGSVFVGLGWNLAPPRRGGESAWAACLSGSGGTSPHPNPNPWTLNPEPWNTWTPKTKI